VEDLDGAVVPGAHGQVERVQDGEVHQQLVEAGAHLRLPASFSDNNHSRTCFFIATYNTNLFKWD
jgi:hypothetical protein